ncbi:hypothetical protein B566_EDAN011157 [Ephemera danica]|nr:hypothetical protein B566_EDAN011157 [Ephemera danica]
MACSAPLNLNTIRYTIKRQYDDQYQLTKQFSRTKLDSAQSFYRKDLYAHFGCVNAIEFSNEGQLLVSGGDDRRVLVWRVEDAIHGHYKPTAMRAQHISNIFCLGYNSTNTKIFSAGNDDQVIVHDAITGDPTDYFLHEQPVYGLSIDPLNDNVFASACDDGQSFCMASYPTAFHGVMFNPMEPRLIATANSKEGVGLWDVRKPRQELIRYGGDTSPQSCMSVRFNQRGSHILALRRRLPPVLYHTHSPRVCAQFDHAGYYNSCTMKSCSFAGAQDEYVLSGSDDFNLYMWKIPNMQKSGQWVSSAHMILRGHRSIVNQVRFNPTNNLIASSGVEKIIKFWSPFQLPGSIGDEGSSAEDLESRKFMSHDYSHQSTQEDPRMMAFFDSLVQREIEGWSSEDSVHSVRSLPLQGSPSEGSALIDQNWSPSTTSSDSDPDAAATAFVRALQEKHLKKNSNSTTSPTEASSSSNPEPNRITQLIAKKRAQLMRLAKAKMRYDQKEAKKSTKRPTKLKLARFRRTMSSPPSTTSSSSSKTAVSDDSSSNTEDWCFQPGTSNARFSSRTKKREPTKLNGLKRPIYTSSDDDESNSDGTRITFQKNRKRLKSKATSSATSSTATKDNYNRCKSKSNMKKQTTSPSNEQPSTSTSVPNHNALQSTPTSPIANFSSAEESSLEDWNKPGLGTRGKKYSATPDSGIDLSASQTNGSTSRPADSDGSEKLPTFTKGNKNRCKRNYRSRVANIAATDSDTD